MPGRDIIVIGASAGGVEALKVVARSLPADLPAAVFVVLHVPARGTSILPQILTRNGPLAASHPSDGEAIVPGRIYVAPPDRHMLLRDGAIRLTRGPKENGLRPAADALFLSAARSYGRRVIGAVLSGTMDDGSAGLRAIKRRGGLALIQDPDDALYPGMPLNARRVVEIDEVLPIAEVGRALDRLAREVVDEAANGPVPEAMEAEADFAEFDLEIFADEANHPGIPSGFGCPDCGGAMWESSAGELLRYRCRVGHAWSAQGLLARQSEALEEALWVAMRALEERAALAGRLLDRLGARGSVRLADRYRDQRSDCLRQAALIRDILVDPPRDIEPHAEAKRETSRPTENDARRSDPTNEPGTA